MQITHVSPRYFPAISGSEFYIQELSENLQRRSHKVKVFCSNALDFHVLGSPKGKSIKEVRSKINQVDIYRSSIKYIPGISFFFNKTYHPYKKILKKLTQWRIPLSSTFNILTNGPFSPELFLQILRDQPDVIHSVCMPFATNLFALLAGKFKKIPTVCTPFYHYQNPRYNNPSYIKFLGYFDKILTCSQRESLYLVRNRLPKDKIHRIHMGITPRKYFRAKPEKFRDQFNIADEQDIVLFCGYKNFEKGAISLLFSIKHIVKKYPNCLFTFIGPSTTAFNRIKRNLGPLRKHIINLGVVPYYSQVKLNAFAAQTIYAMPSRSDAFGIAFLEAWVNKKPVIGANLGATPEIITNGIDGVLVPFHSPLTLAKAICHLLGNPKEAEQLGENGYKKVQNYTWDKMSTTIEGIYEELIQN
ncbi:MAG: glycosyltransferase family 4 protein [Candidatus Helarchaeota archaeon]